MVEDEQWPGHKLPHMNQIKWPSDNLEIDSLDNTHTIKMEVSANGFHYWLRQNLAVTKILNSESNIYQLYTIVGEWHIKLFNQFDNFHIT